MLKTQIAYFLVLLLSCLLVSCNRSASFNPFGNDFNVSQDDLRKSGCVEVNLGNEYYTYTRCNGQLRPYYQFPDENLSNPIGKGFIYHVDTHFFKPRRYDCNGDLDDSLRTLKADLATLDTALKPFGYQVTYYKHPRVEISNGNTADTLHLEIYSDFSESKSKFGVMKRYIEYYNLAPVKKSLFSELMRH